MRLTPVWVLALFAALFVAGATPARAATTSITVGRRPAGPQLLKLEIGGDANSTDGSEPSVEHSRGTVDCAERPLAPGAASWPRRKSSWMTPTAIRC